MTEPDLPLVASVRAVRRRRSGSATAARLRLRRSAARWVAASSTPTVGAHRR